MVNMQERPSRHYDVLIFRLDSRCASHYGVDELSSNLGANLWVRRGPDDIEQSIFLVGR